ncbi:GGDEF domain-containing protein [Roseibium sediminis]|uniref:GGDEF domain-containing protein n=1 Tax=Roseibium sediminis TaxID=1775174 RepID=UPI00123CF710|nr:GGDEF domain-containing protein [Roseibium sediminis]
MERSTDLPDRNEPPSNGEVTFFLRRPGSTTDIVESVLSGQSIVFHPLADTSSGVVYGYRADLAGSDGQTGSLITKLWNQAAGSNALPEFELDFIRLAIESFQTLGAARGTKLFVPFDGRALGLDHDPRSTLPQAISQAGLAPANIVLDLASDRMGPRCEVMEHSLALLRQSGLPISLAQFGSGNSDLQQLHDLSPDFVTIDRYILDGIETSPRKRLLLTSVTSLARVLGARIVAEDIQTEREYKICRDAGCDLVQGTFIADPVHSRPQSRLFYEHLRTGTFQERRRREEQNIHRELVQAHTIRFDASIRDLLNLVVACEDQSVIPVVDDNQEPRGLIHERDLKAYLYGTDIHERDRDQALEMPLQNFIRSCPIADIDSDANTLLLTFAASLESDGIVITENFRYAGFLSATSLLKIIHEKRLLEAQDQNPLTRLPGNAAVARFLIEAADKTDTLRHLCYLDFDNFKPFNDRYGFRQGDRAILMFGELLQRTVNISNCFHGHIGGDDFFVGLVGQSRETVLEHMEKLKTAFRRDIESFYSPEDRARGHIVSRDRFGVEREFPLLDCSVSVLSIPPGLSLHPDQLNREIACLKGDAKQAISGLVSKTLLAA